MIAGVCRVCGCTDENGCVLDADGKIAALNNGEQTVPDGYTVCHWVEPDLCSGCVADKAPPLLFDADGNPIGRAP